MKCLICSIEIDDKKEFPVTIGPQGQQVEDVLGKFNHAQELGKWTHVTLTAQKAVGSVALLSGHICSAHSVTEGSLVLITAAPSPIPKDDIPVPFKKLK